jgi:hypothetical protein
MLHAGYVKLKLFAEALQLLTHAVFQFIIILKMAPSECILQGVKNMEVREC